MDGSVNAGPRRGDRPGATETIPPSSFPNQYRSDRARAEAAASYDGVLARWPVQQTTSFVETRFGPTHVIACGTAGAPPVVLLHGLSTNATSWFKLVPFLAPRHRLHLVDTIGDVGKSAGTRLSYGGGDHARWLADVLDGLALPVASVVGLSAGGWIALRLALAHPERVSRLALLAPASLRPMNPGMLLRVALAMAFNRPAAIRALFRYLAGDDAPVMPDWAMEDTILRWRAGKPSGVRIPVVRDAELRALGVPALLLLGRNDPIYDAEAAAARVRAVAPQVEIEIVPEAGHLFPSQRPAETSAALLRFFEGSAPARVGAASMREGSALHGAATMARPPA